MVQQVLGVGNGRAAAALGGQSCSVYPECMRVFTAVLSVALLSLTAACGGDDDEPKPKDESALCEQGCVDTLAANCPNSPADQASCVSTCKTFSTGTCKAEYAAFQACAEGKAITCSSVGIPVVEECTAEQNAFIACQF